MDAREELAALRRLAELEAKAARAAAPAGPDPSEGGLPFRPFGLDTGLTMPQGVSRFAAGAGKALYDLGRGARQVGAEAMDYVAPRNQTLSGQIAPVSRGDALRAETDEQRKLDAPLMKTGAGLAGNIAGNVAALAPTLAVPGANTYTGAAIMGGLSSALAPVGTQDSRAGNAALGAGAGVAGQFAGRALGRALRPVASKLGPQEQALASAASHEGIPLTAGQATGSRPLQITESVMENLPLTSGSQLAGREAQQRAFTAAALRRAGIAGDAATPELLASQKAALGGTMEGIAKGNVLDFNRGLVDKLAQITGEAGKRGEQAAAPINSVVDNILKEVGAGGKMAGETYQWWRQMLRPLASGGGSDSHYFGQIRKALDEAFNAQMEAAGSEAWKGANRQYANLKTIMSAAGGPGVPAATNQLAPSQLSAALRQSVGKEGVALGRGDLNELARVGTTFVKDQVPNSGTAQRQLIQSLLTTGGGAGVGATAAAATGHNPLEGAAYGLAAGGASLAAPRIVQALMNSPTGQAYLTKGAVALTEAERAALANALRLGAIGGAQGLIAR